MLSWLIALLELSFQFRDFLYKDKMRQRHLFFKWYEYISISVPQHHVPAWVIIHSYILKQKSTPNTLFIVVFYRISQKILHKSISIRQNHYREIHVPPYPPPSS